MIKTMVGLCHMIMNMQKKENVNNLKLVLVSYPDRGVNSNLSCLQSQQLTILSCNKIRNSKISRQLRVCWNLSISLKLPLCGSH